MSLVEDRAGNYQRGCCANSWYVAAYPTRLFRKASGMPPATFRSSAKPPSGRYLSFAEREDIALFRAQAFRGGRSGAVLVDLPRPSRVSCDATPRRAAAAWTRASTTQWHAEQSAGRAEPIKLALNTTLRTYVEQRLAGVVMTSRALPFLAPPFRGRAVGRDRERIDNGPRPGAPSRLLDACRSTSRTTRRCAPATKPSIRLSLFRAWARCAVNCRPACENGRVLRVPRPPVRRRGQGFVSPEIMIR
ncbi:hypothetical protein ABIC02_007668 [Bradyrhizobium sp. RT5a]